MALRRFRPTDAAVSAVLAVILLVALTVSVAGAAYVWVAAFEGTGDAARSLSASVVSTRDGIGVLAIASASTDLRWSDLRIVADGPSKYAILAQGVLVADRAWNASGATAPVAAGDVVRLSHRDDLTLVRVRFVDQRANTVMSEVRVDLPRDATAPRIVAATRTNPSILTFDAPVYAVGGGSNPRSFFQFTEVSGDGDTLATSGLVVPEGTLTISLPYSTGRIPDPGDRIAVKAGKLKDLAGHDVDPTPFVYG